MTGTQPLLAEPLSQAFALARGFDIYGSYTSDSLLSPILDLTKSPTQSFTFLGRTVSIPNSVVPVEDTSSSSTGGVYSTKEELQTKLAASASVEGTYGAFEGQLTLAYEGETRESNDYNFGYHVVSQRFATLQLNPDPSLLTRAFQDAVAALPDQVTDENYAEFCRFFDRFGIYYTSRVTLGAKCSIFVAVSKRNTESTQQIDENLEAQYKGVLTKGKLDQKLQASLSWKTYQASSKVRILTEGGDPRLASVITSADPFQPSQATLNGYNGWLESTAASPAVIDFQLTGIWDLCGTKSAVVRNAWGRYGQQTHPTISIETMVSYDDFTAPDKLEGLPVLTLGQQIRPAYPPDSPNPIGFHVVILNSEAIGTNSAVVFNKYFTMPGYDANMDRAENEFSGQIMELLEATAADVSTSPYMQGSNVLIVATIGGLRTIYHPQFAASPVYGLLRSAGAGDHLQAWIERQHITATPHVLCYALVGVLNSGPGTGVEVLIDSDPFPVLTLRAHMQVRMHVHPGEGRVALTLISARTQAQQS